ncbi:MAG: hypothetical protein JOZ48_05810 [Acidobacteriaceae bacterium]|nr:hypothetical protein [Acidobacteriaceae bacterium]
MPLLSREKKFSEGDPNSFWGRSPNPEGAQQKFSTRAQGAGIARSECPVEMGYEGDDGQKAQIISGKALTQTTRLIGKAQRVTLIEKPAVGRLADRCLKYIECRSDTGSLCNGILRPVLSNLRLT